MNAASTAQIQILVDALVATGWRLWIASHNNTPAAQLLSEWMRDVAPGQLVLEVTTVARDQTIDRVGELLAIASSHECTIRTLDGREVRWGNAAFVRIPRNDADNHEISLLGKQNT